MVVVSIFIIWWWECWRPSEHDPQSTCMVSQPAFSLWRAHHQLGDLPYPPSRSLLFPSPPPLPPISSLPPSLSSIQFWSRFLLYVMGYVSYRLVVLWSLGFHASSGERGGGRGRGLRGSYRIRDIIRHAQHVYVTGFAEANGIVKRNSILHVTDMHNTCVCVCDRICGSRPHC